VEGAEFLSIGDVKEAKLCLSELREAPKAEGVSDLSPLVAAGVDELFNAQVRGVPGDFFEGILRVG